VNARSFRGQLLIATPPLEDENFDRTVVLLLEHGEEGALGVVLNRPLDEPIEEPLDRWVPFVTEPAVFFGGGPVERQAVIALARGRDGKTTEHFAPIVQDVGTVDLTAEPDEVVSELSALRLFHGYAGWGGGQLEGELSAGAWIVVDFDPADAFSAEPGELWRDVLGRQRGRLGWMGNFPDDPEVN
jgi:putative transcriptional regulator